MPRQNDLHWDTGKQIDGEHSAQIVDSDSPLVKYLFTIGVVEGCIELQEDIQNEKHSRSQVDDVVGQTI